MGCEMGDRYYDFIYDHEDRYRKNYKELVCYPLFQVALSMIKDVENPRVLELGCGTGQFAQMLWDNGIRSYLGIDFSPSAIGIAQELSGQVFKVGDIRIKEISKEDFNVVLMLETLEHLGDDCSLIEKIPQGMNIIFSVPQLDDPAHVRTFPDRQSIDDRYGELINIQDVVKYHVWYIVKGVRSGKNAVTSI